VIKPLVTMSIMGIGFRYSVSRNREHYPLLYRREILPVLPLIHGSQIPAASPSSPGHSGRLRNVNRQVSTPLALLGSV
jgi:hypothetical protein